MLYLTIDGHKTHYRLPSPLVGFDSDGNRKEFKLDKSTADSFLLWSELPEIIVYDENGNEVVIDTREHNVTGMHI